MRSALAFVTDTRKAVLCIKPAYMRPVLMRALPLGLISLTRHDEISGEFAFRRSSIIRGEEAMPFPNRGERRDS